MFDGSPDELTRTCRRAGVDNAWLAELSLDERSELAQALRASGPHPSSRADPQAQEPTASQTNAATRTNSFSTRTRWGGVFVLASVMHWRRWPLLAARVLQAWPQATSVAAALARALQHAVALQALLGELDDNASGAADLDRSMDMQSALHDHALASAFELVDAQAVVQEHAAAASAVLCAWITDAAAASGHDASAEAQGHADLETLERQAAGSLLGVLAERVPGCEGASPAWLRSNLLTSSAQLHFSAERGTLDVRLTRAPLHVLLLVAGLTSGRWPAGSGAGAASWQVNISTEELS